MHYQRWRKYGDPLADNRTRHGKSHSRAYRTWADMLQRCNNPAAQQWPDYGGRGITVDPGWLSFESFYADMGDPAAGLSLDRIDNDGPYSSANCRWATQSEQNVNRRPETHCRKRGHEMTADNTYINPQGQRSCVECRRIRQRESARAAVSEV